MVRAKFKVDGINRSLSQRRVTVTHDSGSLSGLENQWVSCEMRSVIMSPVYGNSDPAHENTKFWASSPSGKFELNCINLEAANQFELGKEYYIDITPAA